MEVVSYDRVKELQSSIARQRVIIRDHLALRESIRTALGMTNDEWVQFIDQCKHSSEFSREVIDPVSKYKIVCQCLFKIIDDSDDKFARTIAQELVKMLSEEYILSITGETPYDPNA